MDKYSENKFRVIICGSWVSLKQHVSLSKWGVKIADAHIDDDVHWQSYKEEKGPRREADLPGHLVTQSEYDWVLHWPMPVRPEVSLWMKSKEDNQINKLKGKHNLLLGGSNNHIINLHKVTSSPCKTSQRFIGHRHHFLYKARGIFDLPLEMCRPTKNWSRCRVCSHGNSTACHFLQRREEISRVCARGATTVKQQWKTATSSLPFTLQGRL